MNSLLSQLEKIRMLILDVDGVLTDGSVLISSSGEEMKQFYIRDGYGLKLLQRMGIQIALISGRYSKATEVRARELGIDHIYQGTLDKLPAYEKILEDGQLRDEEVAYMGEDWMDLPLLSRAGFAATVSDATEEAKKAADYVASKGGGRGAVREVVVRCTRHVLSTTLTTAGGFGPLLLAGGTLWPPLAITIAGGVLGATSLALYFVPAAFLLTRGWRCRAALKDAPVDGNGRAVGVSRFAVPNRTVIEPSL